MPHKRNPINLTKTKYCQGLQCTKALFLEVHQLNLKPQTDLETQRSFDQGKLVGAEARKHYPGGIHITFDHLQRNEAVEATQKAIKAKASAIFEAAIFNNNTLIRIDVLKNNGNGTWDIIEVKSSTKVKDEHIPDMEIQRYIAIEEGLKIGKSILKLINNECTYPDLSQLFIDADCTEEVLEEMRRVPSTLKEMFKLLEKEEAPETDIGDQCDTPYECAYKIECWKKVPKYSVFELRGVWGKEKSKLYKEGFIKISDIPEGKKVSRAKEAQILSIKRKEPVIDKKGLKELLSTFKYPLYFLDFETINPAIPLFKGTRPYQHIPFQYSIHILDKPGGKLRHVEYLADNLEDPRHTVAEGLVECLGEKGSIVAYHASFEKTRIEELSMVVISKSNELLELLPRFVDLENAFTKYYEHPDFHGSTSIKAVLPVLVPKMTYEGMAISNGVLAQIAFEKLTSSKTSEVEKQRIRKELLDYCKLDSEAMVKLFERLQQDL